MIVTSATSVRGALVVIALGSIACSKRDSPTLQPSNTIGTDSAAVVAALPTVDSSAPEAERIQSTAAWCWKLLPAPFANENLGVMVMDFTLASTGKSPWLGYSGGGKFLSTYEAGAWTSAPVAASPTSYVYPSLASTRSAVWVAWSDTGGSQSRVHVARRSGSAWVPVGGEVGAYPDDFTNAGEQALAVDASGNPSIVWTESKPGAGGGAPRSLHASSWNGSAWLSLGMLDTNVSYAAPSIAVDATGAPWVAWMGDRLHVARRSGTAWVEAPVPPRTQGREPHIVIEPGGVAFVTWMRGTIVAARTNGSDWNEAIEPPANGVQHSALQMVDGAPVIAWSEARGGELASAQVARWVGGRWVDVIRGMQADTGQSDVGVVALAPSDEGFYLAWDEPGADKVRARVIEARPCATGETPAPIPASKPLESFWPKTVDDAVTQLVSTMDEASKKRVRDTPRSDLYKFHLGWGMGIRNQMGLWKGNAALLASCHTTNPEECSTTIIEKTWERLQTSTAAANDR